MTSAIVKDSKVPKGQSEPIDEPINEPIERSLDEKILQQMRNKPNCTYDALAESLGVSRSTIKRAIKLLTE